MGAISSALAKRCLEKGTTIELNATVKSINVRNGSVTGVTLEVLLLSVCRFAECAFPGF
jgi:phytoene dehydrogenase-like protein